MTFKTAIAALFLALSPGLAMAYCGMPEQTASTCGEGMVWDEGTMSCIVPISS